MNTVFAYYTLSAYVFDDTLETKFNRAQDSREFGLTNICHS